MELHKLVYDLLFQEQCVIVPEFGGFITRESPAGINTSGELKPRTKSVFFNAHMLYDDGLLLNYVSKVKQISFNEAKNLIAEKVREIKSQLEVNKRLKFGQLGDLIMNNEGSILLLVNAHLNLDLSSFGLEPITLKPLTKKQGTVVNFAKEEVIKQEEKTKRKFGWIPVAASLVLLAALGFFLVNKVFFNKEVIATNEQKSTEIKGGDDTSEASVISVGKEGDSNKGESIITDSEEGLTGSEVEGNEGISNLNENNTLEEKEASDHKTEYNLTQVENTDVLNEKYLVVLGSFLGDENAVRYSEILAGKGLQVILLKKEGSSLKRLVFTGSKERETADQLALDVKNKFHVNATVFDNH